MDLRFFLRNGRRVEPNSQTVRRVEGHVDRFVIDVRSMGGVSSETIKNLIEQRHEVTKIERQGTDVTVS